MTLKDSLLLILKQYLNLISVLSKKVSARADHFRLTNDTKQ